MLGVSVGVAVNEDEAQTESFGTLFDDEWRPMVQLAFLITGSHAVAEEVVQEAMASVFDRWNSIASPGGYLRTTVVRSAARHKRNRRREDQFVASSPALMVEQPDHDDLWDHLADLNSRQRSALVLRFYADLPMDDIATILECRPATARSLVRRGLEQLRKKALT